MVNELAAKRASDDLRAPVSVRDTLGKLQFDQAVPHRHAEVFRPGGAVGIEASGNHADDGDNTHEESARLSP